ncbi:MAG: YaeQ family protein [Pseudolysinimonas sp.]
MAAGAVIYNFTVQLADVDRGVYEELTLRVAQHPSETDAYMVTRVLAYCLEYVEGIAFSEGISAPAVHGAAEPAVLVRDRTGRLTTWIEVGAPDAARLHFGSKLADRTTIYTHRDPQKVLGALAGKKIHQLEQITRQSFDPGFVDAVVAAVERRNALTVSVSDGTLYLEVNGVALSSSIHVHQLG